MFRTASTIRRDTPPTTPTHQTFESGATRDLDTDKLDYEGFLSPLVLMRYAQYMHAKRRLPDGSMRDSDNWQLGIPIRKYMKSKWRHFMDTWLSVRGLPAEDDLETSLCAEIFNTMGLLHEVLGATSRDAELRKSEAPRSGEIGN